MTKNIEGTVDDDVAAKLAVGEGRQADLEQVTLHFLLHFTSTAWSLYCPPSICAPVTECSCCYGQYLLLSNFSVTAFQFIATTSHSDYYTS
jgi:hypothetical protein